MGKSSDGKTQSEFAPDVFRTSDGRVFQEGSQLSLHNGVWWWDVGAPVAPEGAEKNLPLWDPPGGTWSRELHEDNKRRARLAGVPSDDSQRVFEAMRDGGRSGDSFEERFAARGKAGAKSL